MSSSKDKGNSAFNLDRFYQDLKRVQSSLGKGEPRKKIVSPVLIKQQKSNTLNNFKKQLHAKELAKTKINLDTAYQSNINRHQKRVSQGKFAINRGELQGQKDSSYEKIKEKFRHWRKLQLDQNNESIIQLSKVNAKVQRSEEDQSLYSDFLQKTADPPTHANNQMLHGQLLHQLAKRNEIYRSVSKHCQQEKSYYRKTEADLSIKLQEHFREHKTMVKVIQQFKRICGLEIKDLKQLYDFLREGNSKEVKTVGDSEEDLV